MSKMSPTEISTTQINIISIVGFEYVQRVPAWMDVGDGEVGGDL